MTTRQTGVFFPETKQITVYQMEANEEDEAFNQEIQWNSDQNQVGHNSVLLEKFFPSFKAKAKRLDEFLLGRENLWKKQVEKDNIWLHLDHSNDNYSNELVSQISFCSLHSFPK